jgi:hypothetical protein
MCSQFNHSELKQEIAYNRMRLEESMNYGNKLMTKLFNKKCKLFKKIKKDGLQ